MRYWAIRTIGKVSVFVAVLILFGGVWEVFAPGSRFAEYTPGPGSDALAYLLIGLLAIRVRTILEDQSRAIESLRERLDQVQLSK